MTTRPPVAAAAHTATGHWLRCARITGDPAGDLIADMCREPDLPSLFRNIEDMRGYLRSKGACPEAITTTSKLPAAQWRLTHHHMSRAEISLDINLLLPLRAARSAYGQRNER
jgi:hypothetical protein